MAAQQPKSSKTDLASLVCLAGSLWWSVLAAQQPKSSKTDLASLVCLAVLRALPWWSVLPKSPKTDLAMLVCLAELLALPHGGPFWPLSSPNPPKRASPAWSAGLCSLLFVWWSVLAAQQPKSVNTDLPCSSNLIGLCPFLSLVLRFVHLAAQILQNGPRQLGLLGCAPCSLPGGPFWPLSSPNPPKRTSPAWSAWLGSLLSL